jgi:protease-4
LRRLSTAQSVEDHLDIEHREQLSVDDRSIAGRRPDEHRRQASGKQGNLSELVGEESMAARKPRRSFGGRLTIFLILGIGLGAWLAIGREAPVQIDDGSTLVIELSGQYVEAPRPSILGKLMGREGKPFRSLLNTFARAERDSRIETVILSSRGLSVGWGKADEIRSAVRRLRGTDRKVIAYLELENLSFSRDYYVASAADEIHVAPGSVTPLVGLAAQYLYLGGLWDTLGVKIETSKAGKYKSAVETLGGREMSEASREMSNSLLDSAESRYLAAIAEGRSLAPDQVRELINRGFVNPQELLDAGLIDGIRWLDEIEEAKENLVRGSEYAQVAIEDLGFEPETSLALIYGSGSVVSGKARSSTSGGPVFASGTIRDALADAAEDEKIKGVILRIDSPGGSAMASEVMWNAVKKIRDQGKPVVVSVSDYAASGGYYVASAADAIVIPAGALTGSIGVFSVRPTFEVLLGKLDIGVETLTRGQFADFGLSANDLSPGARDRMNRITENIYRQFIGRVAEGRGLTVDEVDAVGQGRVWSGEQALEIGLVDELGGLTEAIKAMLRILELDEDSDVDLVPYPEPPTLAAEVAQLLEVRAQSLGTAEFSAMDALEDFLPVPEGFRVLNHWLREFPLGGPLLIPSVLVEIR